jgi:hypothetical protein
VHEKGKKEIMAKIVFGNHSSVLVPRQDRDRIRKFYCDVLGGKIMKADPERDFVRLGDDFLSGSSTGTSQMRASSCEVLERFGWNSNPIMLRR